VRSTPTQADHFSGDRWYFGNIEYQRDEAARLTGFKVNSGSVRNLRFQKAK
jgi:hypothetical protein